MSFEEYPKVIWLGGAKFIATSAAHEAQLRSTPAPAPVVEPEAASAPVQVASEASGDYDELTDEPAHAPKKHAPAKNGTKKK
jgi:hypothetical protein